MLGTHKIIIEDMEFSVEELADERFMLKCNFFGEMRFFFDYCNGTIQIDCYETERSTAIFYKITLEENIEYIKNKIREKDNS